MTYDTYIIFLQNISKSATNNQFTVRVIVKFFKMWPEDMTWMSSGAATALVRGQLP